MFSLFSFAPTIWLYQQFQYFGTEYHVMSTTYMRAVHTAQLHLKKLYLSQLTQAYKPMEQQMLIYLYLTHKVASLLHILSSQECFKAY